MAAKRCFFCQLGLSRMLSKLVFLSYFYFICTTESTVFTEEEGNKQSDATLSTTGTYSSASIEDTLFTSNVYGEQPSTQSDTIINSDSSTAKSELDTTSSETNIDHSDSNINTYNIFDNSNGAEFKTSQNQSQNSVNNFNKQLENASYIGNQNQTNETNILSGNISEIAGNSTNKTIQPFYSCAKYNLTQQNVIVLKDKNHLIWWLDELNKTASCAVVLFYAKWCYFSASLAPMYNAVGRAFSGIPILAIDGYTHNSLNTRYGIVGVPTIILFQESRPVARFNRSRTFNDLVEFIHQSTGMEYNASVEVSSIDYEEGPLASTPSDELNFHLIASICFLLCLAVFVLWRLQYIQVFVEYLMSLTLVRTLFACSEREKND